MKDFELQKTLDFFKYWQDCTQPAEFYNEGWLTRLLIFSVTDARLEDNDLFIQDDDKYFSEALQDIDNFC